MGQKVHSIPRPEETSSSFPLLSVSLDQASPHGNRILATVACSCRSSGAEIRAPHAPTLPFPRTFPTSSLRSEAAEPPSFDEAFNMQSPWAGKRRLDALVSDNYSSEN